METNCCNILKIIGAVLLFLSGAFLVFSLLNYKKCRCIKGKAHKIFDDMGEFIGEFNFKR